MNDINKFVGLAETIIELRDQRNSAIERAEAAEHDVARLRERVIALEKHVSTLTAHDQTADGHCHECGRKDTMLPCMWQCSCCRETLTDADK